MSGSVYIQFSNVASLYRTFLISLFVLTSFCNSNLHTQPATPVAQISIDLSPTDAIRDSVYSLQHQFLVGESDTLILDSAVTLQRGVDYRIDYRLGSVIFDSAFVNVLRATGSAQVHRVSIHYRYFPFRFDESYYRRKLVFLKDTTGVDEIRVAKSQSSFRLDDIFGSDLQKSGSIFRGFTVGTNRDLTLNSGLRMQLSGRIATDVEVVASLTDENTPIQPEGTTQTLQEFDKVFVEIRGTDYTATIGDFNLDFTDTEFGRVSRKLQGVKGTAKYRYGNSTGSATLSGAVPRGKYNTIQHQGIEGVQGPYRLTGQNNERNIIIIAGTEKVFINGELQTRGETNDYVIDYATGEVTFTARRLITAASRIVIDFEYTDRQYSRSLFATGSSSEFFGNAARLNILYFREADDPDNPVDFSITDSARSVLTAAGDDRSKAVVSGVTVVDSNGFYIRVDTTLNDGRQSSFFRYAPGKDARYIVTFSNVGFGKGDYVRQQLGVFVWKGPGGGDYLPQQLLPLPQSEQLIDLRFEADPTPDLKLGAEYGRSTFDANRFSTLNDDDNAGYALEVVGKFTPPRVHIGDMNIGGFDVSVRERFIDHRFVPVDRINDIEFNRKWGIDSVTRSDEEILEASLKYLPTGSVVVGGGYGKIRRGNELRTVRNSATLGVRGDGLPTVDYILESIRSKESLLFNSGSWLRQKGSMEYAIGKLIPSLRYEGENRKVRSTVADTLKQGSVRFDVLGVGARLTELGNISLFSEYEWRIDDLFHLGSIARESRSFTQSYGGKLSSWNNITSSLNVTLREKEFSPSFRNLGNSDITTVLVRNLTRYAPSNRGVETDVFYEVATERSSKLERVFVKVAQGTGNYRYAGDLNGDGIADEAEFALTRFDGDFIAVTVPTEELFPVIDLKTSLRLRLRLGSFFSSPTSDMEHVLANLSTETYLRIEEKSSERDLKQIYLLHFSKFQQDLTTIMGSTLFIQDIFLFEGQSAFSTRLRHSQRKGLTNLSGGIERNFVRERSIRLRWQLVAEIANQIDFVNKIDRVSGGQGSNRLRDIHSDALTLDFSYRPEQNIEIGMKFDMTTSSDRFQSPSLDADVNAQGLRIVYALQGAGQVRVEATREEVTLGRTSATIPFELTGGRMAGKTWLWRVSFDYRVTEFVQATVNYDARTEADRPPVHTARAEVRAFF